MVILQIYLLQKYLNQLVPTVANVAQTIAPATATTITITGTNFVAIPQVDFVKTDGSVTTANTVSFSSATSLSVNVTLALGNYYVRIENPDGNSGRSTNNIITASTAPSFSTSGRIIRYDCWKFFRNCGNNCRFI